MDTTHQFRPIVVVIRNTTRLPTGGPASGDGDATLQALAFRIHHLYMCVIVRRNGFPRDDVSVNGHRPKRDVTEIAAADLLLDLSLIHI